MHLRSIAYSSSSFSVLLPVLFVIALGYVAERTKRFDADQVKGINELVLDFALPAVMFVGIVKTALNPPAGETAFDPRQALRWSRSISRCCWSDFMCCGIRSAQRLYRLACSTSIGRLHGHPDLQGAVRRFRRAVGDHGDRLIANPDVAPMTVLLMEMHAARTARAASAAEAVGFVEEVVAALKSSFLKPVVWAPLAAIAIVAAGIPVPRRSTTC